MNKWNLSIEKPLLEEKMDVSLKENPSSFSLIAFLMAALIRIADNTSDNNNEFISTADEFENVSLHLPL